MSHDSFFPPLISRLLKRMIPHEDREFFLDSVQEVFARLLTSRGKSAARFWLIGQVLRFFPGFLKIKIEWSLNMLKNYFKMTLRHIKRQKGFSFINISGLAIGMTCFILIILYIRFELSFDTFHKDAKDIFRVVYENSAFTLWNSDRFAVTPPPLGPALREEYPEVLAATRLRGPQNKLIIYNELSAYADGLYADDQFFNLFDFPMISGDRETCLKTPHTIVLSERLAAKLFGTENPLGKIVDFNEEFDAEITGIFQNIPKNSHLQFDFAFSLITLSTGPGKEDVLNNWANGYFTYIKLSHGYPPAEFSGKINKMLLKFRQKKPTDTQDYFLLPLEKIHLSEKFNFENAVTSDPRYITLFSAVAFFILLLACINYMNLSTARYGKRMKEVGIRKVVGARRFQLIRQFTGESFILTFLALGLSLLLVRTILPAFNRLIDKELPLNFWKDPLIWPALLITLIFVGLFSGSYPAFYLSRGRPSGILKGKSRSASGSIKVRNTLVVAQFSISIILIICTALVFDQLGYIRHKDAGYDRDRVIIIQAGDKGIQANIENIKNELLSHNRILGVSSSDTTPLDFSSASTTTIKNDQGENIDFVAYASEVDYDFIDVYGIPLTQGRYFSRQHTTDTVDAVVVNEKTTKLLDWKDPLGRIFPWEGRNLKIIGVIKDYHYWSMHREIEPMILLLDPSAISFISVKTSAGSTREIVEYLRTVYEKYRINHPFNYSFMDDQFARFHADDRKFGNIFSLFSLLSLCIASLGLFGLASFTAEQKTKEIGIRKILGATLTGITGSLSWEFSRWVILANLIAWPVAYWGMKQWLKGFAYRIHIGIWLFILSGLFALLVAVLTTGWQTFKAARRNPIDALRYE